MKVLVLGASGAIGFPVSQALVRAGHEVYAQTRDEKKRTLFESEEFTPIVLDPTADKSWSKLVPTVDAVIDTLGGTTPINTLALENVQEAERAAKESRNATASKLTYIWTSGTWIHGEDRLSLSSDGSAIEHAPALTAWRPSVEQPLIKSTILNGIVIRPSMLYGRGGSIFGSFIGQAAKGGPVYLPGDEGVRFATVHADDLAQCYRLAVEKAPIAAGNIFDASNAYTVPLLGFIHQLSAVSGLSLDKFVIKKPEEAFEAAVATTNNVRPTLARSLLGWETLKPSLIDGLATYYRACLANDKLS